MKLQNWAIVSWLSRCCLKRACQSRTLAGQEERAMRIVILAKSLWSRKTVQENYNAICDQVAAKLHGGGVRLPVSYAKHTDRESKARHAMQFPISGSRQSIVSQPNLSSNDS